MVKRAVSIPRGFTILELVVVLAVLTALVAFLAPSAFQTIQASRENETEDQLRAIFTAIRGEPSNGNYGYLGDMGRLPTSLDELVTQGTQTAWHTTSHQGGVGRGWRGPYITRGDALSDLFRDAWGQTLSYSSSGGTAGQITSYGPDGQASTTGDNIVYPVQVPVQTTGTILVTVIVNEIPQPAGLTVSVYSTTNGDEGTASTQSTSGGSGVPFRFTVPHGTSTIVCTHTVSTTTVTRTVTIDVAGGTQVSRTIIMKTSATVSM